MKKQEKEMEKERKKKKKKERMENGRRDGWKSAHGRVWSVECGLVVGILLVIKTLVFL